MGSHTLISGVTESGKTHLAKQIAGEYRRRGIPVFVCDPFRSKGWPADFETTDPERFLAVVQAQNLPQGGALFCEEASKTVGKGSAMEWVTTMARNWAFRTYLLTQRPAQVERTIRDQCTNFFFFHVSSYDAREMAKDFNSPLIRKLDTLPPHWFVAGNRWRGWKLQKLPK